MKGHRFDYVEDIQANATRQLRAITESDYQRCFRQWQERWNLNSQATKSEPVMMKSAQLYLLLTG